MIKIPVPEECVSSEDPYDLVWAFTVSVNDLLSLQYRPDELPAEVMQSYYVDFYNGQVGNAGLAFFIGNSHWDPELLDYLEGGLTALNARGHQVLLQELSDKIAGWFGGVEEQDMAAFFTTNATAAAELGALDARFKEISDEEDLVTLNNRFIHDKALFRAVAQEDYQEAMDGLAAQVPDREARLAEAERAVHEEEPDEIKLVREICSLGGQKLLTLDGVFMGVFDKQKVPEVHVTTDAGAHYVVIYGGFARLFVAGSKEQLGEWEMES